MILWALSASAALAVAWTPVVQRDPNSVPACEGVGVTLTLATAAAGDTKPQFTVVVSNDTDRPVRVLDVRNGRRTDLHENYFELFVVQNGKVVETERPLSDPGPVSAGDFLELRPGQRMDVPRISYPGALDKLAPGQYQAVVLFWRDPLDLKTRCRSTSASFTVPETATVLYLGQTGSALQDKRRNQRRAALRQQARERIADETLRFSVAELADIEARYAAAHLHGFPMVRRPEGEQILLDLVSQYPRSNRAGCALLELAQISRGARREHYLREAIGDDRDAWFEDGVQVAALARAMLAVHLAGLERFDEAEEVATELVTRFPGAIDHTGATLDGTLNAIGLLK